MVVFPNCKINIGLNVIHRRTDGFHDIETVFYPVPWTDILEIIASETDEFIFEGIKIDCRLEDNLCYKAFRLLKNDFNLPAIKLFLYKNIPQGAGLGGGSSDAAFVLTTLNKLFSLHLTEDQLMEYASKLGSDCAFFIRNQAAFATGKGEILSPVQPDLKDHYLLIVKPPVHVSTVDAFKLIVPVVPENSLRETIQLPVSEWRSSVKNDFEQPVFSLHPELKTIKEKLYDLGAVYASMSGSGSAVYGLFDRKIDYRPNFEGNICWMNKL